MIISGALWVALKKKPTAPKPEAKPQAEAGELDEFEDESEFLQVDHSKPQVDWCGTAGMIPVIVDSDHGEDVRLLVPTAGAGEKIE